MLAFLSYVNLSGVGADHTLCTELHLPHLAPLTTPLHLCLKKRNRMVHVNNNTIVDDQGFGVRKVRFKKYFCT